MSSPTAKNTGRTANTRARRQERTRDIEPPDHADIQDILPGLPSSRNTVTHLPPETYIPSGSPWGFTGSASPLQKIVQDAESLRYNSEDEVETDSAPPSIARSRSQTDDSEDTVEEDSVPPPISRPPQSRHKRNSSVRDTATQVNISIF